LLPVPIHRVSCGAARYIFGTGGTLILEDLEDLDASGQTALLHWLDRASGAPTQIIGLAQIPLYPRVRQRRFDDALYYRLNVIRVAARLV
jgi:DNA-binding NtrC family response regulator